MENTSLFQLDEIESAKIKSIIKDVCTLLKERGYDPLNQIAGYLISGDPGYISNYKDARKKITSIERTDMIAYILKEYLK